MVAPIRPGERSKNGHQKERVGHYSETWWPRTESNGHVPFGTTDFKSGASTSSATGPWANRYWQTSGLASAIRPEAAPINRDQNGHNRLKKPFFSGGG